MTPINTWHNIGGIVLDSTGRTMAECEYETTAALIVRAVNSHDALINACEEAAAWFEAHPCDASYGLAEMLRNATAEGK